MKRLPIVGSDRTGAWATFIIGSSIITTWRLAFLPWSSYWDHVPPPYGWGTSPLGWTDDLLGSAVWVNGSYWLWPVWLLSHAAVAQGLLIVPAFLAPLGFFALARRVGAHPAAAALGSVYYLFNPSFHARYLQGHTGDLLGYASAPLIGLAVWSLLESPGQSRLRAAVIVVVTLFLGSSLKPHWFALQVFAVLPFVLALFMVRRHRLVDAQTVYYLAAGVFLTVLLNLPMVVIALSTGSEILQRLHSVVHLTALSSNVPWFAVTRLAGEPAMGLLPRLGYYRFDVRGLLGFVPTVLMLLAPLAAWGGNRRLAAVAAASWVASALLSTGVTYLHWPYLWLYAHLPFFTAFRESSKFLMVGALFAATGLSLGMDGLFRRNLRLATGITTFALVAIIVYAWPMVGGDMGISATRIYQPSRSEIEIGQWLRSQRGEFRVMVIPHDDETFHVWPMVSQRPLFGVDNDRVFSALPGVYDALRIATLGRLGEDEPFAAGLARAGVRFVVVRHDGDSSSFKFTSRAATIEPDIAQKLLDTSSRFRKVLEVRDYVVYENRQYHGLVWMEPNASTGIPAGISRPGFPKPDENPAPIIVGDLGEWVDPSEVDVALSRRWITGPAYEWLHPGPFARGETTHSKWYAITQGSSRLGQWITVPRAGNYYIRFRGLLYDGAAAPEVSTNGHGIPPTTAWPRNRFGDIEYGLSHLNAGRNHLEVRAQRGLVAIDTITVGLTVNSNIRDAGAQKLTPPRGRHRQAEISLAEGAYRWPFGGAFLLHLRGIPPGTITVAEASHPEWMTFAHHIRARIIPGDDALLHIGTDGGTGTVIVWNKLAMLITLAWFVSAASFLIAATHLAWGGILLWWRRKDSYPRQAGAYTATIVPMAIHRNQSW